LQNNNPEQAKGVLLTLSSPPISRYYQLLAQIQRKLGNTAEAHLALAEDFYLQGRTALALNQLEHAREQEALDFYVAARIEARYQALKTLLQEEQESSAAGQP
jgi:predicted Zn-dependent protease